MVYADVASLGQAAFAEPHYSYIEAVIKETMNRSAYNFEIIYQELSRIGYNFNQVPQYSFEIPLTNLSPMQLNLFPNLRRPLSHWPCPAVAQDVLPTSRRCNFAWDYTTDENILWEGADLIQIAPLDDLVEQVTDEYWHVDADEFEDAPYLELSADYLHKDNVSGGPILRN